MKQTIKNGIYIPDENRELRPLDACEERVKNRMERGVMGELKK